MKLVRCDADGCEQEMAEPMFTVSTTRRVKLAAGSFYYPSVMHSEERHFCSWPCVSRYAIARQVEALEGASDD